MIRGRPILSGLAMAGILSVAMGREAGARQTDTGPVLVQVVDAQRNDVPHIPVQVIAPDQSRRTFTAGVGGVVSIPNDLAVEGAVLTASRGRESLAWLSLDDAASAGPGRRRLSMTLIPLIHRVEGSVVDRAGKPVARARVGVEILAHPINKVLSQDLRGKDPLLGFAVADDSGKFRITLPENTQAHLRAMHSGFVSPAIEVAANARTLNPVTLEPTGGIRGRLTDMATGKPVARAAVAAQLIELHVRHLTDGWGQAVTDDRGEYAIDGLEPGVYNVLLLEIPGRERATARAVEAVRVRANDVATADLSMIEGKPLRGLVIDRETNRPMVGAQVGCQGPAVPRSGAAILGTKTDAQGRFSFPVPPGEQFVYLIDDPSSRWMSRRRVVVPDQVEAMPVFLLSPKRGSDLPAPAEEPQPPPPPVPAIAVAAVPVAPLADVRIVEEAVIVPALPPAPAPVAPAAGAVTVEVKTTTVPAKAKAPVAKPRTLTGRVKDSQGRPLVGVGVSVDSGPSPGSGSAPNSFGTAVTDQNGTFELAGVPRRNVPIMLGRPGEVLQKETLPADRDDLTLTYRPRPDEKARNAAARVEAEPIPPQLRERLTFVDLTPYGSNFLSDGPGNPGDGNNLDRLPRGVHKLGDAYFRIGEKMVQVKGNVSPEWPESITGIKVAAKGKRLHFLHACQQQAGAGTELGHYLIHFADGSREKVPIVYGKNLVDWWHFATQNNDPSDARIVWTGSNEMIEGRREAGLEIHLFAFVWTNPHPDREISTIDVVSSVSECDPFLIAVTLERE